MKITNGISVANNDEQVRVTSLHDASASPFDGDVTVRVSCGSTIKTILLRHKPAAALVTIMQWRIPCIGGHGFVIRNCHSIWIFRISCGYR